MPLRGAPTVLFPLLSIWVFNPQQRMKEVLTHHLPSLPRPSPINEGFRGVCKVTVSLPPFCENVTAEQANSALYLSFQSVRWRFHERPRRIYISSHPL